MRRGATDGWVWLVIAIAWVCGCRSSIAPLPTYQGRSAGEELALVRERSKGIHDISGQALLTLTEADGRTIRLEAALVMAPPDRARIRAFKFNQPVFDLTITERGSWIAASSGEHREQIVGAGSEAGRSVLEWLRLMTGDFDPRWVRAEDEGNELVVTERREGRLTVVARIDRRTLTARRYTLLDEAGKRRFELLLSDYGLVGGKPWPMKIEASSERGGIMIELHDLEINGGVAEGAFVAPRSAEKLK